MLRLVFVLALAVLVLAAPALAARKPKPPPAPAVTLMHANTHERYTLRPDAKGQFRLKGWARFLRCHHTGRRRVMSPKLARLLYDASAHFDFKPLVVVAGYRAPQVARRKGNPRSPHPKGLAVDFYVRDISNTELRDYVRNLEGVGVGFYPNSHHVHVDVRRGKAFWIDHSTDGQRAIYDRDPQHYLVDEAATKEGASTPEDTEASGATPPEPPFVDPATLPN